MHQDLPVGEPPVGHDVRSLCQNVEEDDQKEANTFAAKPEVLEICADSDTSYHSLLLLLYRRHKVSL